MTPLQELQAWARATAEHANKVWTSKAPYLRILGLGEGSVPLEDYVASLWRAANTIDRLITEAEAGLLEKREPPPPPPRVQLERKRMPIERQIPGFGDSQITIRE